MHHEVLTITLNPAVDKNYTIEHLVPEHKMRCPNPRIDAGGGGINVSKGIRRLGGKSTALTLTGGRNGELLKELLRDEGVDILDIPVTGETREGIVISEVSSRHQYRIVVDGPEIEANVAEFILEKIRQVSPRPSIIVASGSLPKGINEDYYARIGKLAREMGAKYIVDSSGKPLQYAVDEGVYLVKPNLKELSAMAGIETLELDDVDEAAMELIKKGRCEVVMVSLGASGAMLVTAKGYRQVYAPTVERRSTVGAGDSLVAGMVWSIVEGRSLEEMAMMGVACGTAATMNPGTQLFKKEDVEKLYKWISR
jgi:6-phosphofructokinase 2